MRPIGLCVWRIAHVAHLRSIAIFCGGSDRKHCVRRAGHRGRQHGPAIRGALPGDSADVGQRPAATPACSRPEGSPAHQGGGATRAHQDGHDAKQPGGLAGVKRSLGRSGGRIGVSIKQDKRPPVNQGKDCASVAHPALPRRGGEKGAIRNPSLPTREGQAHTMRGKDKRQPCERFGVRCSFGYHANMPIARERSGCNHATRDRSYAQMCARFTVGLCRTRERPAVPRTASRSARSAPGADGPIEPWTVGSW